MNLWYFFSLPHVYKNEQQSLNLYDLSTMKIGHEIDHNAHNHCDASLIPRKKLSISFFSVIKHEEILLS